MRGGGLIEQVDLAGDGFFALLFLGGDSSIQGGALQESLARGAGLIRTRGPSSGPLTAVDAAVSVAKAR
jgi:hypothetical protein